MTPARVAPAAFLSYVRSDDDHEEGQIRLLQSRLEGEVRMQLGRDDFHIFLDREDIGWGENWRRRIESSLDAVTLLIPVLTPAFFASPECRREVERFLERERELGRDDLVLSIYYLSAAELEEAERREGDELARTLAQRQHADWRSLRFEPLTSPVVRQRLAQLAGRMRATLSTDEVPAPREATSEAGGAATKETPSRRNEPPALTVDPWGHGDHMTISEAIAAARPGTQIAIRPGLYEESLVVEKPLELLGQGPVEEIIVRARDGDAILFRANIGRVANLTLQHAGGGQFYAIDIAQGRLELEGCDITCNGLAVVGVHDGADPRVRRCRIGNGPRSGILVYDGGLGTFEDNEILENDAAGIAVRDGGNPTFRRNRIRDGHESGIFVQGGATGTFEDNDIFANRLAGVEVTGGGNPTVRRNRIHDGLAAGVFVYEKGLGTFEDNEITANAAGGVVISSAADPTFRHNHIHAQPLTGVDVDEEGRGTFEDNDITGNGAPGIRVRDRGDPVVRRNRIHEGLESGVLVHDGGRGTFEDNDIRDNGLFGVVVLDGGDPTVKGNRISGNGEAAIGVTAAGAGTFEDNDLRGSPNGAFDLADGDESRIGRSGNLEDD
jgi:parallel beta-helix repeat protein